MISDLYKDFRQTVRPEIGPKLSRRVLGWWPHRRGSAVSMVSSSLSQPSQLAVYVEGSFHRLLLRLPQVNANEVLKKGAVREGLTWKGEAGKRSEAPGKGCYFPSLPLSHAFLLPCLVQLDGMEDERKPMGSKREAQS